MDYVIRMHDHNDNIEKEIISYLKSTKEEVQKLNNTVQVALEENKKLTTQLRSALDINEKLESRLKVSENTSVLLKESMEKLIFANAQYSRRECLEVAGIPLEDPSDFKTLSKESTEYIDFKKMQAAAEKKCLKVFKTINVHVVKSDLHACHRLKNGNIIAKFISRRQCEEVLSKRHSLKDADLSEISDKRIYINASLCPHYKTIFFHARQLASKQLIDKAWISNGTVHIRQCNSNSHDKILHISELKVKFPELKFE